MSSSKKPRVSEDLFSSIPPQESFDAFPSLSAFPEDAIAFLTGKAPTTEPEAVPEIQPESAPLADIEPVSNDTKPHSKPAEQPDSKPKSKPVSKPNIKSASKPDSQPAEQPATKPLSQSEDQPEAQPADQPTSQSTRLSANQKTSLKASQSTSHTTNLSSNLKESQTISPSEDLSQSPTQNLSSGQPVLVSVAQPSPQPPQPAQAPQPVSLLDVGRFSPTDRLNDNQRRVLDLLLTAKPYIVKFRDIAASLGMREASVRTIMRRLMALSMLTFHKARDGNIQGVRIVVNQQVLAQYPQDPSISQSVSHSLNPLQAPSLSHFQSHSQNLSLSPSFSQPNSQPTIQPDYQPPSLKIEKKENLSIEENPFGWDDAFVAMMWPQLTKAGFGLEQIRQAVAARERLGKPLDREMLVLSLDRGEWELEVKGSLTDLTTRESVRNVAAYIFTALSRWGALRAHPDYVSREELAAKEALDELRRCQKAADDLDKSRFDAFVAGLTPAELEAILRDFPGGNKDAWLKKYWREQVREQG